MKKGQSLPTAELFTFTPGQQVALYSERKGLRMHYDFVSKLERFYVVKNTETGTEHRVWFNKVLTIGEAKKKAVQIEKEIEKKLQEKLQAELAEKAKIAKAE